MSKVSGSHGVTGEVVVSSLILGLNLGPVEYK